MSRGECIERIGVVVLAAAIASCSRAPPASEPGAPTRVRRAPVRATEASVRAGVASLGEGGAELLALVDDDAWMLHHGSTDIIHGADAIGRYLTELASAYPRLHVRPRSVVAMEDEGWLVEAAVRDETRDATGRFVALIRTRRRAVVSVEVFGDHPDTLSVSEPPAAPALPGRMEIVPADGLAPDHAMDILSDSLPSMSLSDLELSPQIRLTAEGEGTRLLVIAARGRDPHGVPVSIQAAAVEHHNENGSPTYEVYANPRQTAVIEMGNLTVGHENLMRSKLHSDALRWGAWQGYCCEHGARTRSCRLIDLPTMPRCRAVNRLAFVCRQAYHCSGPECFCCASGLDAACEMDDVPELEPDVPASRRPAAPTVWSPY